MHEETKVSEGDAVPDEASDAKDSSTLEVSKVVEDAVSKETAESKVEAVVEKLDAANIDNHVQKEKSKDENSISKEVES